MTFNQGIISNTTVTAVKPSGAGTLLGNLVFTSIGDLKVDKNVLNNLFNAQGLSLTKYQPGNIRPSDAMRRATSTLKNKKVPIVFNGDNKTAVIDITESVTQDATVRYVGRKVIDEKGKKVQYDQISTIVFDKKNNSLTYITPDITFLSEYPYDKMLEAVVDLYTEWCQYHTKDTVRNIINKLVGSLMPTPIKPSQDDDSVAKFIPSTYSTELKAMKRLIDSLKQYHINGATSGCQFIELFDSPTNKQLLEESFKNDIKSRIGMLIAELTSILQNKGSISLEKGKILAKELVDMRSEAKEYAKLLNTSVSVLEQQIATALSRVESAQTGLNSYNNGYEQI